MKKVAAILLFIALASPAFAAEDFATREAERSGVAGTFKMIGNSIGGFFSSFGSAIHRGTSKD